MQWLLIFKLVVLLTVANGTPVIAGKLFGNYFNQPLDGAVTVCRRASGFWTFENNSRDHTFACGGYRHRARTWFCMDIRSHRSDVAMSGDLLSSFLKRRLSLAPSSRATGIDQIPECLLPTLSICSTLGLGAFDVVSVVIIFFLGQVILSRLFFRWNIRNRPY